MFEAVAASSVPEIHPLPTLLPDLFRPRVFRPGHVEHEQPLDYALDTVREVRRELVPEDVVVNLSRREVRPVPGDRRPDTATDDDAFVRQGRFPSAWTLAPIRGLSGSAYALRDTAFQQLLGRVRFRRDHLERFPLPYQHRLLNYLVQAGGDEQPVTVRVARGTQARALVTDAYTPFDDVELLDAVHAVVSDHPELRETARITWMDVRETGSHVRIVWGDEVPITVGDVVRRGLHVSNSEVGSRAVRIEGLVFRLVCLNGMVAASSRSTQVLRHVGNRERLVAAVRDAVDGATHESDRLIAAFRRSLAVPLQDPAGFLAETAHAEPGMTADDLRFIVRGWQATGADRSLYAVTNAITGAAQRHDGERRYELEAVAGRALARGIARAA